MYIEMKEKETTKSIRVETFQGVSLPDRPFLLDILSRCIRTFMVSPLPMHPMGVESGLCVWSRDKIVMLHCGKQETNSHYVIVATKQFWWELGMWKV